MQLDQIEIRQIEARTCHTGRHKSERRKFFRRDVTIEGPRVVMSIGTHERNGPMTAKVDLLTAAPDVMKAWTGAALAIAASLEPSLMELVKIRASQINGCANCINMHAAEARSQGETEQRIYLLPARRRRERQPDGGAKPPGRSGDL